MPSRMGDGDKWTAGVAPLPAPCSRADSIEHPIDTWGDVSSSTALIATSAEEPRELSDGGSGIFTMVLGEASRFAMYIDDEVELAIREASDP